jgi:hypothetical protein
MKYSTSVQKEHERFVNYFLKIKRLPVRAAVAACQKSLAEFAAAAAKKV